MVIRQADYPGAQLDVARAVGRDAHENFRRRDGLPTRAMMLPHPGFVKAQGIHPLDQFQIPLQGQGRILVDAMKRRHEDAEFQFFR